MDELEISGKRYISTRRAGKENKYHSDYIGQLIRGGKVKGQKVGRSWYVDEASLSAYLGKEVKGAAPKEFLGEVEVAEPETPKEEKVETVVEAEVEIPTRATTWKKIPEVARTEVAEDVVETSSMDSDFDKNENIEKEETSRFVAEVEKEVSSEVKIEEENTNHIFIRTTPKEEKKNNITYVANDAPLFPVKVRKQKLSAPVSSTVSSPESVEEDGDTSVVVTVQEKRAKVSGLQYGAVAMLGVFAFILVGGMSYLLSYKTTVEGDQMSASITLSK